MSAIHDVKPTSQQPQGKSPAIPDGSEPIVQEQRGALGITDWDRVGNVLSVGLGDESVGDVLGTLDLLGAGVSV